MPEYEINMRLMISSLLSKNCSTEWHRPVHFDMLSIEINLGLFFFRNRGIPWANVFAFNSDNCSVMKGQRNGLISKLRKVSPNIIDVGCVCHLANLAVGTTLKKVPVNVDELLCDIFSHFSISSKRIEELKEFQSFVGVQEDKLLKHCPTRWLSVRRCLARLLEQYEALKSYFISHPDAEKQRSKVARLNEVLSYKLTLPWLNFVMTALEPYHTFNQKFQSEDVLVTDLYNSMLKLIRTVMAFYVPVSTIKAADNISEIEHTDRSLQCHDIDVNCGTTARALITALEDTVPASEIANFFSQVRDALEAGVTKMVKVFPLASKTLQLAPIAVPGNKDQYTLPQVQSLASAFSISDPTVLDKIGQEWLEFQLEDIEVTKSVGEFWCDSKTGAAYPNLANLMRVLLSIPHSNASCERVFSMLKKIATEQRTHLAHDTINALLRLKINSKGCCIDTEFDSNMLKNLKRAATDYNTKHMFGSGASTSATPDPAE